MSSLWTNDVVLEYIELYRREPILWDPKHPLHRNRIEVAEAWNRIEASLSIHCSVTDLKKKKESLMTSFRLHLNKKKSLDGYRTTWFAFPLMESFLGGKYECDSTNHLENEYFTTTDNYSTQPETPDHSDNRTFTDKNTPVTRSKPMVNQKNIKNSYQKKRLEEPISYSSNSADSKPEMDEYDLYGQLLAKKLRKLNEHQRDLAMHEIDNVMFRAKMGGTATQSKNYPTSSSPISRKLKSPVFIVAQHNLTSNIQFEDENISYEEESPS